MLSEDEFERSTGGLKDDQRKEFQSWADETSGMLEDDQKALVSDIDSDTQSSLNDEGQGTMHYSRQHWRKSYFYLLLVCFTFRLKTSFLLSLLGHWDNKLLPQAVVTENSPFAPLQVIPMHCRY